MPLIGDETPHFVLLPVSQRWGPPLPDLLYGDQRSLPVRGLACLLAIAAGVAIQWPDSFWIGWLMQHGVVAMPLCSTPRWSVADAGVVLAMWCSMLVMMALPGVMLRLRAAMSGPPNARVSAWRLLLSCCADGAPAAFALGHMASALALALLLTAVSGVLSHATLIGSDTALRAAWAGPWLIALGLWQWMPWQPNLVVRSIARPVVSPGLLRCALLWRGWLFGWRMATTCAAPMLAMFALGIMNIGWMTLHVLISAAEQQWPRQRLVIARLLGLFWLAMGIAMGVNL